MEMAWAMKMAIFIGNHPKGKKNCSVSIALITVFKGQGFEMGQLQQLCYSILGNISIII